MIEWTRRASRIIACSSVNLRSETCGGWSNLLACALVVQCMHARVAGVGEFEADTLVADSALCVAGRGSLHFWARVLRTYYVWLDHELRRN